MAIPAVPSDLYTAFNNVVYYDEPHKYFIGEKQLISVTTLIHKYENEFNESFWSKEKSFQYNVDKEDLLYAWKFINETATLKGSIIHDYAENLFNNKVFPYPENIIIEKFGYDPIKGEYDLTKRLVDKFYRDVKNKLIPIKTELVVCDDEYGIGGMVDMLFYNIKAKEFQIWDWKTNREFEKESSRSLRGILGVLEDSDLEKYSLQLSTYKHIIKKNTSLKLGKSYIVWFSCNNDDYEIIETNDRETFVKMMIEDYLKKAKGNP